MTITVSLICLSYRISPLVPKNEVQEMQQASGKGLRFVGQHDEFISSAMIVCVNCYFVEAANCTDISSAWKAVILLLISSLVAIFFLVVLR